jgi:hypothetical protein
MLVKRLLAMHMLLALHAVELAQLQLWTRTKPAQAACRMIAAAISPITIITSTANHQQITDAVSVSHALSAAGAATAIAAVVAGAGPMLLTQGQKPASLVM